MRRKSKNMIAITLGAAGAGAGLMFLLDPDRGGRRRGFVGDKAVHVGKFIGRRFERRSRDLENRAQGVVTETTARVARERVPNEILAERVRSKIGRVVTHPRALDVTAERGVVELRGAVLRSERRRAIRCAESVRGVRAVQHDALMTYSNEQGAPGSEPQHRPRELKEAKPRRGLRALRVGLALASGAVAVYKALKSSERPRPSRSTEPSATSSSDIAA